MATNQGHEYGKGDERNPEVGYDKSDLGAKGILAFFFVLAVFAVAVHLVVLGMYIGMTKITEKHDVEASPLAPHEVTPRPGILTNTANVDVQRFPEPRLQSDDTTDMTRFLLQENTALNAQPWQDQQGNVHLPIAQAMQTVLPRLPVRAGGTPPPDYPGAHRYYSYPTATSAEEKEPSSSGTSVPPQDISPAQHAPAQPSSPEQQGAPAPQGAQQ